VLSSVGPATGARARVRDATRRVGSTTATATATANEDATMASLSSRTPAARVAIARGVARARDRAGRSTSRARGAFANGDGAPDELLRPVSDAALDGTMTVDVTLLAPVAALGVGYGAIRAALYSKLQFAVAEQLASRVPAEAVVIELGVDTKNLYYYPKSTKLVVCVAPDVNTELVNRIAIETSTPVLPRSAPIAGSGEGDLFWGQARESADAVVTTGCLAKMTTESVRTVARKAAQVLRPGGRFLFVEPANGERGQSLFDAIEATNAFETPIAFDESWATLPLFPHAIGVAIKKDRTSAADAKGEGKKISNLRSRRRNT